MFLNPKLVSGAEVLAVLDDSSSERYPGLDALSRRPGYGLGFAAAGLSLVPSAAMGGRGGSLTGADAQSSAPAQLRDEVPRTALLDRLQQRWSVPLVLIDAPGGYGKSTLLGQAMRENANDPIGRDVYIPLIDADRDPAVLLRTVLPRLGHEGEGEGSNAALLETMLQVLRLQSPDQIALLFDDVHWVAEAGDVRRLFAELLHQLPANVHVVLAGRQLPKVPIARLLASDDVLQVNEADLLFSPVELEQLARHHEVGTEELALTAGWPAVARLAATVGHERSLDFMMEEVVDGLDEQTRRALAAVLVAGAADQTLFSRLGVDMLVEELAARVPLMDVLADGSIRPHDLWRETVDHLVDADERLRVAEIVAEWQLSQRRPDAAIAVAAEAGLWEVARRAICSTVGEGDATLTAITAERWLSAFPPEQADEPELLLLQG
ncbi:MAG: AAA family ATPase, partial [Acidimicrobiia bacterium]